MGREKIIFPPFVFLQISQILQKTEHKNLKNLQEIT